MDVVKISMEALLQRATNPQNENIDTAAVEAFCALVNKEKDGPLLGVKLLATRMHSKRELEALQTLHILDYAMHKCGALFQDEIGKFRFLNEMIKLVSPKYLGAHTPLAVKQKVLQLMYLWMLDYPKQSKIKDAYDMLKKQGVIKDVPLSVSADYQLERQHQTIFQDEEKGKLLKKLLQSKNPEDLQAANRLIKTMVKEDEKKAELKSRRISVLESVQNNIRLLNEMLDSYKVGISSQDETELIKELHESCVRMRPSVAKLASETHQSDEMLSEILRVNDEMAMVFDKYHLVIEVGKPEESQPSLLDLSMDKLVLTGDSGDTKSNVDVLCDILAPIGIDNDILQPTAVHLEANKEENSQRNKQKAFEALDALGENLLLENLQSTTKIGSFGPFKGDKTPMNLLAAKSQCQTVNNATNHNLLSMLSGPAPETTNEAKSILYFDAELSLLLAAANKKAQSEVRSTPEKLTQPEDRENMLVGYRQDSHQVGGSDSECNGASSALDDLLVDITTTPTQTPTLTPSLSRTISSSSTASSIAIGNGNSSVERKEHDSSDEKVLDASESTPKSPLKLSELFVDLKSIKPSGVEPIVALNEPTGVSLTLHFAKDKPHEDVTVMVASIVNKNEMPMKNVLFRAIVPKTCKVKLQPPSGTDLPACNPFLPPSAITQVLLIANPEKLQVSLKFIVSYNMDDETMTEMGEIDALPT